MHETKEQEERVILVGIENDKNTFDINDSLDELEELVKTAGATAIFRLIQKREAMHKGHYLGKGKLLELKEYIETLDATGIVCDDELTQMQIKNMESALDTKIMNRTLVILDIFAKRANTAEGKVQVELAQLKYSLSHLKGTYSNLSRLGGGIGTRGPGEKKLETDKRNIFNRIAELNIKLKEIEKHRKVIRENRLKNKIPIVAFVGYTNAGKSTLLNTISDANILAEDKLFATLDTTTRKVFLQNNFECLFIDTVGFIQKLPHNLIKAFKSTLEEVKYADILIHVVDSSNNSRENQMQIVYDTLKDLKCLDKPIITVFNKIDKLDNTLLPKDLLAEKTLNISAKTGKGIEDMLLAVEDIIKSFKKSLSILIPYEKGSLFNLIYEKCDVISKEDKEEGVFFEIYADNEMENKLKDYII